jgi:hypothetical protein
LLKSKKPTGVREALETAQLLVDALLSPQRTLMPVHTRLAAQEIELLFDAKADSLPDPVEQETVWKRVGQHLANYATLDGLSKDEKRQAPWVIFYPQGDQRRWIAADATLSRSYLEWLANSARPRMIASTIAAFLTTYQPELPYFELWRIGLAQVLDAHTSPRLSLWKQRINEYRLLEPNAPRATAKLFFSSLEQVEKLEKESGLDGVVSGGEFMKLLQREFLVELQTKLSGQVEAVNQLERAKSFCCDAQGKTLRFDTLRSVIADSMLLPFRHYEPEKNTKSWILKFLLRHLAHPLHKADHWRSVNPEAVRVFQKWMVGDTLLGFFSIIKDSALDTHWSYRQQFWWAYHEAGYIENAWVVLGDEASRSKSKFVREYQEYFGRLVRGAHRSQSALIFEVPGFIVTEWSHNGMCRWWSTASNASAPQLGQEEYSRWELTKYADEEMAHHGSDRGAWQAKFHLYMHEQMGLEVSPTKFLPKSIHARIPYLDI